MIFDCTSSFRNFLYARCSIGAQNQFSLKYSLAWRPRRSLQLERRWRRSRQLDLRWNYPKISSRQGVDQLSEPQSTDSSFDRTLP